MDAPLAERIRFLWIRKKGPAYAAVSDVIDDQYPKLPRPLIIKQIKLGENAFKFLINLPPGKGFDEFKKKERLFADATGGSVHIEKHGTTVTMEVLTEELKNSYAFSLFDYLKYGDMYLPIPLGVSAKGLIVRDLAEYPHFFTGGETNFGKSNFLHVVANSILLYRPEAFLVIVDPKSTEFAYLADHALVIDEMENVRETFKKLNEEMDRRKKILKAANCVKVQKYIEKGGEMPFIVLIIDELAELQDKEAIEYLWRLLRMGRFIGIHIIAATQRPSSKVFENFGDIKAMFLGRLAFVCADDINSRMILDNDLAAHLDAIKGRAIYKCGLETLEVQTLFLDPEDAAKKLKKMPGKELTKIAILSKQSQKVLPPRQSFALPPGRLQSVKH
ncbi:FtsK/SpoIIIE domain-containing protein [Desulfosporosinus sp.]|uniref:FtsK/SpoIIIE domain-containing protein n=1 Tax=Desulfosporosinus sp. TaxID=157907 RepID=UPI0026281759|nr:FtsK/SpoIIIE domain-containing protein [Desulfosporosinus sp.]MCO5384607.1 FtsK/SpoIIIE domain-containing protein [Desulfosporosinus sp.]